MAKEGVRKRGRPSKGPGGKPKTKGYNYVPKAKKEKIARAERTKVQRESEALSIVLEQWKCSAQSIAPAPLEAIGSTLGSNGMCVKVPRNGGETVVCEQGQGVCYGDGNSLFNVGSLVQTLAWAPKRWTRSDVGKGSEETEALEGTAYDTVDYIAVSANVQDSGQQSHVLGSTYRGWHPLQFWGVPYAAEKEPFLALSLLHEAACIYSLSWCPLSCALSFHGDNGILPRIGVLAACMGDGALAVYAVPHPELAAAAFGVQKPALATATPLLHVCNDGEHFSCVAWHVDGEVVSLGAGTATGFLAVWKFARDAAPPAPTQEPLFRVRLTQGPIRQLSFCPTDRNLAICCSAWGKTKLVDLRRPCTELAAHTFGTVAMALKWCHGDLGIVMGANNSLASVSAGQMSHLYWHKDVIWAIDHSIEEFGATASDDGLVCMFKTLGMFARGVKIEAIKIASLAVEMVDDLPLLVVVHPDSSHASKKPSKAEALSHDLAVVRALSISDSRRRCIAFGGGAGVVFCRNVEGHFAPF